MSSQSACGSWWGLSLGVQGLSPAMPKIDRFAGDVTVWSRASHAASQGGGSCDRSIPPRWSFLKRVPSRSMTRCSPATALIPAFARGLYLAASVSGAGSHGSPQCPLRSDIVLVPPIRWDGHRLHSGLSRRRCGGLPSRHQRGGRPPPLVRSWLSCQRCVGMVRPPRRAGPSRRRSRCVSTPRS